MSKKLFYTISALLILIIAAVSACNPLIPITGPDNTPKDATQVYEAAIATATQIALQAQISLLQTQVAQINEGSPIPTNVSPSEATQAVSPSETPVPPTATPLPTATAVPTLTPVPPTATAVPTATNTPIPCNLARFVSDVSYPDGSVVSPGQTFTKIWRLKNIGSCTWTTTYDLVFYSGSQMGAPTITAFQGNVAPGQVIDVSVTMTAPDEQDTYRGNWKLRDASGVLFGISADNDPFYVLVKVENVNLTGKYPLDFVTFYCSAEWSSGAGRLSCPSAEKDSRGYVMRVDKPTLETGYTDDEPALVTHPQMVTDGVIRGKFPTYKVRDGDRFLSIIGCGRGKTSCDVHFQLDYQIGDGSIQTLKTWHEVYDEKFWPVEVDLSSLAGKDVKFILTVFANGSSTDDVAQWLAPRIVHK